MSRGEKTAPLPQSGASFEVVLDLTHDKLGLSLDRSCSSYPIPIKATESKQIARLVAARPRSIVVRHHGGGISMTLAFPLVLIVSTILSADGPRPTMLRAGGDSARGVLLNHSSGARPFDPPDLNKHTVVFVHGFNPAPRIVHFTMAERFSEAIQRRQREQFNVLSWDWNAATFDSLNPRVNSINAVHQGHLLAEALRRKGLEPLRIHLIGHSAGGMVATSTAHVFAKGLGSPVAQLTLLEPATFYHEVIFEQLEAGSLAPRVENYWSPGPSAYGNEVALPGVLNYQVVGTASYTGLIRPLRSDHISIVAWYLDSVGNPSVPWGFNTSRLVIRRD